MVRSRTAGPRSADGPPKPPQLDQNTSESTSPMPPTIIRITPTVPISRPEMLAFTANVRTAPIASRIKLTPIPNANLLDCAYRDVIPAVGELKTAVLPH